MPVSAERPMSRRVHAADLLDPLHEGAADHRALEVVVEERRRCGSGCIMALPASRVSTSARSHFCPR